MARQAKWPPTIYRHSSGQGRVRIHGKTYYLGEYGSPAAQAEYARLIGQLAERGEVGKTRASVVTSAITVSEVLLRWDHHAEATYSLRGRERDQFKLALQPVRRLFGSLAAHAFGPEQLRQLQQAMLDGTWMTEEERKHPRRADIEGKLARATVNRRIVKIRTVWRWAEETNLVAGGTWARLRAVKPIRKNRPGTREAGGPRTATFDEVRRVCRNLAPVLRAILLLQWWTGMRSGEVRSIRASDIDTSAGTWIYSPREHKTDYLNHSRHVMLGVKAQSVLRPWLKQALAFGGDAPVFPSTGGRGGRGKGQPYTLAGYCRAVRKAADAAQLPNFHAYLCRGATRMRVSKALNDEAARAVLGQRTLDVTLKYGELDLDLAREAMRKLG